MNDYQVTIHPTSLHIFDLNFRLKSVTEYVVLDAKSITSKGGVTTVVFDVCDEKGKILLSGKSLLCDIDKAKPMIITLVAWFYLSKKTFENDYEDKAKLLLKRAIRAKPNSCFPHNLYGQLVHSLTGLELREFYRAADLKDTFPEFCLLVRRLEKNPIRAKEWLRKTYMKYPKSLRVVENYSAQLFAQGEYAKAEDVVKKSGLLSDRDALENFFLIHTYVFSCVNSISDKDVHSFIDNSLLTGSEKAILRAAVYFERKEYKKSLKYFVEAIACDLSNTDITLISTYYMLICQTELGFTDSAKETISRLPKSCNFEYVYPYLEDIDDLGERALRAALKLDLDERERSNLLGLLANAILNNRLPKITEESKSVPKLTTEEAKYFKEALGYVKQALEFLENDFACNITYSALCYLDNNYDKAAYHSLYSYMYPSDEHPDLEKIWCLPVCSDGFISHYHEEFRNLCEKTSIQIRNYIQFDFSRDIGFLYKSKNFSVITGLYYLVIEYIDLDDLMKSNYWDHSGGLFEVAYSLNEVGDKQQALNVYKKELESAPSSSILNNIALIYEDFGDVENAKKCVSDAIKLIGSEGDNKIKSNFERIVGSRKHTTISKSETKKKVWITPQFISESSEIIIGNKRSQIPVGGNQHILCRELFKLKVGDTLSEEDVIDKFNTDGTRSFYDAVNLVNKKVFKDTKVKNILEYKLNTVHLRMG